MSYSITIIGKDKERLKAAIRAQQVKDPVGNPHGGVPARVVDYLCAEVDRTRLYQLEGRVFALHVEASGSFHEQGSNDSSRIFPVELVE